MTASALFEERCLSKVGAVFDDADHARAAARRLGRETGIEDGRIRVLGPGDPRKARKLEPESGGIARTLAKAHITLGVGGLVVGLAMASLLIATGMDAFVWSPWYALSVFGFFGAAAGLLLGALVSLRPDHDRLIGRVETATRSGRWFVLVHVRDQDEAR